MMRNPVRTALAALLFCGLGALLVWAATGSEETGAMRALGVLGALLLLFCSIPAIQALSSWFGMARLMRGENVVARWQVNPQDWKRFLAFDKARGARNWQRLTNVMSRSWRPNCPPQGIEVIVGRKSVLIDGSYCTVRSIFLVQWIGTESAELDCLEFHLPRSSFRGPVWHPKLRIPVPGQAKAQATLAYQWHSTRVVPEGVAFGPRARAYKVALMLGLAGGVLAVIGAWWASMASQPVDVDDFGSMVPWLLIAIGGAGVVLCPILACVAFFAGKQED
ncbi:hypothetical protein [Ottowia sp.]|uniref:hypothetical protein n=1 Tax=Ottowia sp. TaxID=1898956 RepID=UPI003C7851D9